MEIGGRYVGSNVVSRANVVSASRSERDGRVARAGADRQRPQSALGSAGIRHIRTPHRRAPAGGSPGRAVASPEGER
jgi:hypothetical protein